MARGQGPRKAAVGKVGRVRTGPSGGSPAPAAAGPAADPEAGSQADSMQELLQHPSGEAGNASGALAETLEALAQSERTSPGVGAGPSPMGVAVDVFNDEMLGQLADSLGAEGEEGAQAFLDSVMQQLLSKDVLYEPMREIGEKYPNWLAANKEKLPAEELRLYREQHQHLQRLLQQYETAPGDFDSVVGLLQDMQACGQPPQEILKDLAPDLQFGPDGLPLGLPGGDPNKPCPIM